MSATAAGLAPALERFRSIRRLNLGHWPTPIRELTRLRSHLNARPQLWIKHDDWSGPAFGGNKIRKLEYYFGKASGQGYDTVLTTGGIRSNHCRATAALAAHLGFECHLVLNGERPAASPPASFWLDESFGATIHLVSSPADRTPALEALAVQLRAAGRRPMVVPLGASTSLGALGFVHGAAEALAQFTELRISPGVIYHSTSSGGTQAGLLAGFALHCGLTPFIHGISADDPAPQIASAVRTILASIEVDLGAPACSLQPGIVVDDSFTGPGYGVPSDEGSEALQLLARTEGVVLDPVYTAKAMAALLSDLSQGQLDVHQHVLFWHTGGQMALFHAS